MDSNTNENFTSERNETNAGQNDVKEHPRSVNDRKLTNETNDGPPRRTKLGGAVEDEEVLTVEVQADRRVALAELVFGGDPVLARVLHRHAADLQRGLVGVALLRHGNLKITRRTRL